MALLSPGMSSKRAQTVCSQTWHIDLVQQLMMVYSVKGIYCANGDGHGQGVMVMVMVMILVNVITHPRCL